MYYIYIYIYLSLSLSLYIFSLIPSFSFCWPLFEKIIKLNPKVYDLIN